MKSVEERLRSYQPLWENWQYTGEFLGKGGMSSVFEIEHDAYGSRDVCALKIIEVKSSSDGRIRIPQDTLNEIKIMRSLSDCPNIVRYYDDTTREIKDSDGEIEGIDILIRMEKLKSINERTRLSEDEVIKLAKDICNALVYVGKKKIIHRDIKPHNIFVDDSGRYKLGDFGISKIISEFSVNFTREIGTQAYVAPEMFSGAEGDSYDASTDIYSLGLVLYAFLNDNKLPFEGTEKNMGAAIHKRLKGDIFPEPLNGKRKLKEIVMKACSFERGDRYKSAAQMLKDLENLDKPKHEKYIKDPYITIPANDEDDEGDVVYYEPERKHKSIIKDEPKAEKRGGLKVSKSLRKAEKSTAFDEKTKTSWATSSAKPIKEVTGRRLKISKSFTGGHSETAVHPKEDVIHIEEKQKANNRFKKPTREL